MDTADLILLPKLALDYTGLSAPMRRQLAREAGIPGWMLNSTRVAVPSDRKFRLWELVEHELADPHVALRAGRSCVPGSFGLIDYLFMTAPTIAAGMTRTVSYVNVLSNHCILSVVDGPEEIGFDQDTLCGDGRGRELTTQVAFAAMVARTQRGTGGVVKPVRVSFRQAAPRRHDQFVETFGTTRIDFGAPTDQMMFRVADMARSLATADPMLAGILLQHAETAAVRPPAVTCSEQLHHVLLALLGTGPITVDRAASRMATSGRSLQRRLAGEGTTWRRELDRARQVWLENQNPRPGISQDDVARQLGYSDARAFRRARQRWSAESGR
ncbi:AraC family transcriptional regulator ligand-binding domain-containing protein [Nocardia sp. NPDC023852]|uniref:AraC family transcriptional regulator ligand-binding domain-containing protein n=1 Tax=Nocardia sp. NPDC023852 TaxID=3154697 RepID=UPI0033DBC9AC